MRKSVERRISFADEVKMEPQKQVSTTTPSSTKSDGQPGASQEDSRDGEPEQMGNSTLARLSENNTVQQLKEQMDRELKGREEKKSRPIFAVEKHPVPVARQPKGPGSVGFVERREGRQMQSGKTVDVRRKVGPCSVISQKLLDAWVEGCKRMLENREYLGNFVKKEKRAVDWSNVDSEVLIARLEDGEEGQEEILNWILSGDNFQIICDSTSTQVSWVVSSLLTLSPQVLSLVMKAANSTQQEALFEKVESRVHALALDEAGHQVVKAAIATASPQQRNRLQAKLFTKTALPTLLASTYGATIVLLLVHVCVWVKCVCSFACVY